MPNTGTSDRVALRRVVESVFGTTPSSPTMIPMRYTRESLKLDVGSKVSEQIRPDRMTDDVVTTKRSADGDISSEFAYAAYDPEIQAALCSAWATTGSTVSSATDIAIDKTSGTPNTYALTSSSTDFSAQSWVVGQLIQVAGFAVAGTFYARISSISANSLGILPLTDEDDEAAGDSITITPLNYIRNGTTKVSLTYQKIFNDLTTPEYEAFKGSRIDKWSLEAATEEIVKTTFSVRCRDSLMSESDFSSATEAAENTNQVFTSGPQFSRFVIDGDPGATEAYFSKFNLDLSNNLRSLMAIGHTVAFDMNQGMFDVKGSAEIYFADSAEYDRFRAGTAFSLDVKLEDADGNMYFLSIPRLKHTACTIVAGGQNQDIVAAVDFQGLVDGTRTYAFQLSRKAA